MDEARLAEIEATAHSPAYRDEADMIGVDELIAEIRRLRPSDWRTIPDEDVKSSDVWDWVELLCACSTDDLNVVISVAPLSNDIAVCERCGRRYRLVVQVSEGGA